MIHWEQATSKLLRRLRLESIRNKLLAFAVLATLIPSVSMAWISYAQNKGSLTQKITQELSSLSTQVNRELDLWVKERIADLRVFATSYEVSENLARIPTGSAGLRGGPVQRRVSDYLNSVRERFPDYEELIVLDPEGRLIATSAQRGRTVTLPEGWQNDIRNDVSVIGPPHWDDSLGQTVIMAAVPIRQTSGRVLGALAARLNLVSVDGILSRFLQGSSARVLMVAKGGRVIRSTADSSDRLARLNLSGAALESLAGQHGAAVEYDSYDDLPVLGTISAEIAPNPRWRVVAELPSIEAFRQINRLRNVTAIMVTALLLVVGGLAYLLGLLIVRPLDRLTTGAGEVAHGSLEVDLPVVGGGEVGSLTEVFNFMVERLRDGRQQLDAIHETLRQQNEELERLSLTDGLTGLSNRRYLMDRLASEVSRARRGHHHFAVVMADVDLFKNYNDTYGHLAGDEVLVRVSAILQESIRGVDCAARYGGEEFLLLLPETDVEGAVELAERIRTRLADETFAGGKVTISIGIAAYPEFGETPEAVIMSADLALYQAKNQGRNRTVRAIPEG